MEFDINLDSPCPNPAAVQDAMLVVDPAAVLDLDRRGRRLRISIEIGAHELADLLTEAGCQVIPAQILEVPAFCCGSCAG